MLSAALAIFGSRLTLCGSKQYQRVGKKKAAPGIRTGGRVRAGCGALGASKRRGQEQAAEQGCF